MKIFNTIKHLHILIVVHHYDNVIKYVLIISMNGNAINYTVLTCFGTSVCLQHSFHFYLFFVILAFISFEGLWADFGLDCISTCAKIAEKVVKR